jgi:hypothetical protein
MEDVEEQLMEAKIVYASAAGVYYVDVDWERIGYGSFIDGCRIMLLRDRDSSG